ncbi:MAG: FIST N-terminal domain-containing protein [Terriglobia bacterium]|jgi:hypothetical protein
MPIRTAYSANALPEVVWELAAKAGDCNPRVILFFASSKYDPAEVSHAMQAAFPEACVAGCTTAGEIAGGKMSCESIAAMFLDDEIVGHRASAVVEGLSSQVSVRAAFSKMEQGLGAPVSSLDIEKYVGIVLADGLSGSEEALMEKIGDCTDLLFVGGSAGDDLKFAKTHVMLNGQAFTNAAVLLLLETKNGFDIVKTQSFRTTGKTLLATKVDEPHRLVEEFDHQPALAAYAQALGVLPAEVPSHFMKHPLGLMIEKDPYVRSPQRVQGEGIVFYCQIKQGMKLEVLEGTDIVAHTRNAIEARKATGKPISGIIDFQCILRALQLREEGHCDQYGAIFAGIPTVGFSTYGEAYLGHINQTSTMLVFR